MLRFVVFVIFCVKRDRCKLNICIQIILDAFMLVKYTCDSLFVRLGVGTILNNANK